MKDKLLTRDQFREQVFARDKHCVFCDLPAVDAHHILERKLWKDGGYYIDNGAAVCQEHHTACERTDISVEEVRKACGIKNVILPPMLNPDYKYDKWGNVLSHPTAFNMRLKGPLFRDAGVQHTMADKMSWFNPHIKYPRTYHAPWSEGATSDDKKVSSMDHFIGKRVIVTEKMDGENTTFHAKSMNARSLDGLHHVSRDWVKKLWSGIRHEIPDEWRICGENVYAVHSIAYAALDSYFLGFSIWDEFNYALSWEETVGYFDILGIKPVPVLYDGIYDEAKIRALFSESNRETMEGYVIRLAERFHFVSFHVSVAKVVRKNHVTTSDHWKNQQVVPNGLK